MPFAIEMFFDAKSEEMVRGIWRILHEKNISSYMFTSGSRPHITLSVLNSIDMLEFSQKLKTFAEESNSLEMKFGSIGAFPGAEGVLFLSPTVTYGLLKLHESFHNVFDCYKKEVWNYYLPGLWVPHCTLAIDLHKNNLPLAMECVLDNYQPINARIEEIGIVEFRPVKHHISYELRK